MDNFSLIWFGADFYWRACTFDVLRHFISCFSVVKNKYCVLKKAHENLNWDKKYIKFVKARPRKFKLKVKFGSAEPESMWKFKFSKYQKFQRSKQRVKIQNKIVWAIQIPRENSKVTLGEILLLKSSNEFAAPTRQILRYSIRNVCH